MTPTKITEEIYQVGGPGLTAPEDAAIYLLHFGGHAALIDAGCGEATEQLLANIQSLGVDLGEIEVLLLTHCHFDHTGGAGALKDRLRCPVVAHALDAKFIEAGDAEVTAAAWYGRELVPVEVDRKLRGARETIEIGDRTITAIHTPGHSPGSVVYLTVSAGLRVLFAQDVHGPLAAALLSDRDDYLRSLKKLLELDADILCEGHYGVYTGGKAIRNFVESFLQGM